MDAVIRSLRAVIWAGLMTCVSDAMASGVLAPSLESFLQHAKPDQEVPIIVTLSGQADLSQSSVTERAQRRALILRALRDKAAATQGGVLRFLRQRQANAIRPLWIVNGIAARVRVGVIGALALRKEVAHIRLDAQVQAPEVTYGSSAIPAWQVGAIGAPELWALGLRGSGIVVAGMDTGVDAQHPDLADTWRGGTNSWYDPHGQHVTPFDASGHGTQVMGLMAGGSAIGIAPGARWIAVKIFDDTGHATLSDIHRGFQWLLDPDGNPDTDDAPDVVNNSWGLQGTAGQCHAEFLPDIRALRAAGVAVVFAAGNDGPAPRTDASPANLPGSFAVGAVDADFAVTNFSSRGPSACHDMLFPQVTAPAMNVYTADLSWGGLPLYGVYSGTSYAAPLVAGGMALLLQAFPAASVAELETALTRTASDRGTGGPDNDYGYGVVDLPAAYRALLAYAPVNRAPLAGDDTAGTDINKEILIAVTANDRDPDGSLALGSASIVKPPINGGTAVVDGGRVSYRPRADFTGTDAFAYTVKDNLGKSSNIAVVRVYIKNL